MAKSTTKKKGAAILPPSTRIVNSPDWDPNAPDVELGKVPPKRRKQAKAKAKAEPKPTLSPEDARRNLLRLIGLIVAGVAVVGGAGFGLSKVLDRQGEKAEVRAKAAAQAVIEAKAEPKVEDLLAEFEAPKSVEEYAALYEAHVAKASKLAGIPPLALAELRKPNAYYNPVSRSSPKILGPSKSMREGPLTLKVRVSTLSIDRRNIRSKGLHTILDIHNTGSVPLAYRLLMRKADGGECMSPALINYDAIVIEPDQHFEISVCSGQQKVEIIDLRMLEVTQLGALWLRQLPPQALGLIGMAARAHDPGPGVYHCTEDAAELTRAIEEGEIAWEDIVDYYSRHDCALYPWWSAYERAEQPLASLPAPPPAIIAKRTIKQNEDAKLSGI